MSDTLRLLKHDPTVALLILANNHLNLRMMPQGISVSAPTAIGGTLTEVTFTAHESVDEYIETRYTGSFRYRYNRLNVSDYFAGLALEVSPPVTVRGVMNNLALASGLVITDDDFENALVEGSSFELKASVNSLRWVGSTTVVLDEPTETLELSEVFSNNILDGLWAPNFGPDIALAAAIPDPVMDGLVYAPPVNTPRVM
jgi:hypothetical protein